MEQEKRKPIWPWFAALGPGVLSLALTGFGKLALSRSEEITPSIIGVLLILPLSFVLAFIFARGAGSTGKYIGRAIGFAIAMLVVNFAIAFGGCALMAPHLDFR